MDQSEFDYYKRKANAIAVDALKNSDAIPWDEFKALLEKALQYYERTPGLDLLYREQTHSTEEGGPTTNDNNGYPYQDVNEDKKQ